MRSDIILNEITKILVSDCTNLPQCFNTLLISFQTAVVKDCDREGLIFLLYYYIQR